SACPTATLWSSTRGGTSPRSRLPVRSSGNWRSMRRTSTRPGPSPGPSGLLPISYPSSKERPVSAQTQFLCLTLAFALPGSRLLASPGRAYPLPGPEFLGQFMALAAWVFVAFASVLLYPVCAILRFFRGDKPATPPATPADEE